MQYECFKDKTCLVTGAAGGIGLEVSRALLAQGAGVWMADVAREKLEAAAAPLLAEFPGKVTCRALDVSSLEAFEDLLAEMAGRGSIDYLFNNAGIGCADFLTKLDEQTIRRTIDVNLMGVINGCHAVIPYMVRQGGGVIANTGSVASFTPLAWRTIYNATKFGVMGFTQCLRLELDWMESGIRLAVICPSTVASGIWNGQIPPDAVTAEDAAQEILAGLARGDQVIPVCDHGRKLYDTYFNDQPAFQTELRDITRRYEPWGLTPAGARKNAIKQCRS